jgi:hypothetical protein
MKRLVPLTRAAALSAGLPFKEVTWCALTHPTQLIEHVGAKHSCPAMSKRQEGGVAHASKFLKTVKRPALSLQQIFQLRNDHRSSIASEFGLWQINNISSSWFTYSLIYSRLPGGGLAGRLSGGTSTAPCRAARASLRHPLALLPSQALKTAVAGACARGLGLGNWVYSGFGYGWPLEATALVNSLGGQPWSAY